MSSFTTYLLIVFFIVGLFTLIMAELSHFKAANVLLAVEGILTIIIAISLCLGV